MGLVDCATIPTNFALYISKESDQDSQEDDTGPSIEDQLARIPALEARNEALIESVVY